MTTSPPSLVQSALGLEGRLNRTCSLTLIALFTCVIAPASALAEQDEDEDAHEVPVGEFDEAEESLDERADDLGEDLGEPGIDEGAEALDEAGRDGDGDDEQAVAAGEVDEAGSSGRSIRRLSPSYFWGTVVVGLGLGVASAVTGGITVSINRRYLDEQDDELLRQRGMSLQLATNLLAITAGVAALTAGVLAFFTDWSGRVRAAEDLEAVASVRSWIAHSVMVSSPAIEAL